MYVPVVGSAALSESVSVCCFEMSSVVYVNVSPWYNIDIDINTSIAKNARTSRNAVRLSHAAAAAAAVAWSSSC